MTSRPRPRYRSFVLPVWVAVIGCAGAAWGMSHLASSAATDSFLNLETHILQFETFSPNTMPDLMSEGAAQNLSACESHAQRALLLLGIPLADAALRSGAVGDFDQRVQSLERRARETLTCAPRDPLAWLVLFGLQVLHGRIEAGSFDLLAMSYETSPNEAWVALRRTIVATPVVLSAPEPTREKILTEFVDLVGNGFPDIPAGAYLRASPAVRAVLRSRIEQLDSRSRQSFSDALRKLAP